MKRLALILLGGAICACGGYVQVQSGYPEAPPPPPPPGAVVQAPPPPPPGGEATATADVNVEAAPAVTASEPEELTATTEPPDPVYEEPTDSMGPGYVWVGGGWAWSGADWMWYPGRWLMAPAGNVYIEPYYERVGPNVVYVGGYWGRPDAPRRSYGGDRIRFVAAVRPADYRPGERPRIVRSPGAPPGTRPHTAYERATGQVRPLPRTTVPTRVVANASVSQGTSPREMHAAPGAPGGEPHGAMQTGRDQVVAGSQHPQGAPGGDRTMVPREEAPRQIPAAHPAPVARPTPAPKKKK
jgi:hypothetical protein